MLHTRHPSVLSKPKDLVNHVAFFFIDVCNFYKAKVSSLELTHRKMFFMSPDRTEAKAVAAG